MTMPQDAIWQAVQGINRACVAGKGFDALGATFHEQAVGVAPGFGARTVGRGACLRAYEDFCGAARIHRLDGHDPQIDLFDKTAVVSYRYTCTWEHQGKVLDDEGHEVLVFVQDGPAWKVVWRTLVPGSREMETCPAEQDQATPKASMDVRGICKDMMTTLPVCHLTTVDTQGYPQTTAMLNLRCAHEYPTIVDLYEQAANPFLLYMTTSMTSNKMTRLQANPKVSVYYCDPLQIVGFMLSGDIEVVTDPALKDTIWQEGWTLYYPSGPQGAEYGVLRLAPKVIRGWCRNRPFEFKP